MVRDGAFGITPSRSDRSRLAPATTTSSTYYSTTFNTGTTRTPNYMAFPTKSTPNSLHHRNLTAPPRSARDRLKIAAAQTESGVPGTGHSRTHLSPSPFRRPRLSPASTPSPEPGVHHTTLLSLPVFIAGPTSTLPRVGGSSCSTTQGTTSSGGPGGGRADKVSRQLPRSPPRPQVSQSQLAYTPISSWRPCSTRYEKLYLPLSIKSHQSSHEWRNPAQHPPPSPTSFPMRSSSPPNVDRWRRSSSAGVAASNIVRVPPPAPGGPTTTSSIRSTTTRGLPPSRGQEPSASNFLPNDRAKILSSPSSPRERIHYFSTSPPLIKRRGSGHNNNLLAASASSGTTTSFSHLLRTIDAHTPSPRGYNRSPRRSTAMISPASRAPEERLVNSPFNRANNQSGRKAKSVTFAPAGGVHSYEKIYLPGRSVTELLQRNPDHGNVIKRTSGTTVMNPLEYYTTSPDYRAGKSPIVPKNKSASSLLSAEEIEKVFGGLDPLRTVAGRSWSTTASASARRASSDNRYTTSFADVGRQVKNYNDIRIRSAPYAYTPSRSRNSYDDDNCPDSPPNPSRDYGRHVGYVSQLKGHSIAGDRRTQPPLFTAPATFLPPSRTDPSPPRGNYSPLVELGHYHSETQTRLFNRRTKHRLDSTGRPVLTLTPSSFYSARSTVSAPRYNLAAVKSTPENLFLYGTNVAAQLTTANYRSGGVPYSPAPPGSNVAHLFSTAAGRTPSSPPRFSSQSRLITASPDPAAHKKTKHSTPFARYLHSRAETPLKNGTGTFGGTHCIDVQHNFGRATASGTAPRHDFDHHHEQFMRRHKNVGADFVFRSDSPSPSRNPRTQATTGASEKRLLTFASPSTTRLQPLSRYVY
ncbi:unnamed protein product [Amoebophrya sp. A25]|nr:unnamed protein product [Amoebophrya sp. A25]|eukprot:GSA25T00019258001.1